MEKKTHLRGTRCLRSMLAGGLVVLAVAANAQSYPTPTPKQQAGIDKDNSRHFGDSPADGGPLAKLSPSLKPTAVDVAVRKVADWELQRSQPYFDRIWTWSVLYAGFMAASDATGDPKYRDAMLAMSQHYNWALMSHLPNADDQSLGQAYLELYLHDRSVAGISGDGIDEKLANRTAPTQAELDALIAAPEDPKRIAWWWCDALFMAPPVWARMYAATGDRKYLNYLDAQWAKTQTLLYDPQARLFARDATYLSRLEPNGQRMFWSRGNGWVMGGIVRTLDYLPPQDPGHAGYVSLLQQMSAGTAKLQQKDGLWHAGLLDPKSYPLPEISGSALITYAMAWGVNHGVLDRKQYLPVIRRSWRGMLRHVYADGRLGCIQQTGAEPAYYRPTASYNYGVGGFLLAASEIKKLSTSHDPANAAPAVPVAPVSAPPLLGLAHVALRVSDLDRALKFYSLLGIHQAFYFSDGGKIGQAFLKVNDRQFIELYPSKPGEIPGFLHLCFISGDVNALYDFYRQQGLTPTPVKKARAGNLLFTMQGPEKQNIEYTQYMPGSLHYEDRGKHLDSLAIAEGIAAVVLPMADPNSARSFYVQRLGFTVAKHADQLALPGTPGQRVEIESAAQQPRALIVFQVAKVAKAAREMKKRGLHIDQLTGEGRSVSVVDPDGNQLVFEAARTAH